MGMVNHLELRLLCGLASERALELSKNPMTISLRSSPVMVLERKRNPSTSGVRGERHGYVCQVHLCHLLRRLRQASNTFAF